MAWLEHNRLHWRPPHQYVSPPATYPICNDGFHRVLNLLPEPVALQDVNDAQVEDDTLSLHLALDVAFPEGQERRRRAGQVKGEGGGSPPKHTHTPSHPNSHPKTHTPSHPQHIHTHTLPPPTHTHTHTRTHTHTHTHTRTHTHTHTRTHTHTHTHTRTHTHTHTRTLHLLNGLHFVCKILFLFDRREMNYGCGAYLINN